MVMRYYFGLSVGHKYSWSIPNPAEDAGEEAVVVEDGEDGEEDGEDGDKHAGEPGTDENNSDSESEDSDEEQALESEDDDENTYLSGQDIDDESDDEEFLARCEMYPSRIVQ